LDQDDPEPHDSSSGSAACVEEDLGCWEAGGGGEDAVEVGEAEAECDGEHPAYDAGDDDCESDGEGSANCCVVSFFGHAVLGVSASSLDANGVLTVWFRRNRSLRGLVPQV